LLKAGGTYVPLDAAVPEERIRFLLAQLKARHLVTCQELWARWGAPPRLDGAVGSTPRPAARSRMGAGSAGGRDRRPAARQPAESTGSAADLGLRDLHLRVDRPAQGGGGAPPVVAT